MVDAIKTNRSTPVGIWLVGIVLGLAAIALGAWAWRGWGDQDPLLAAKEKAEAEAKAKDEEAKNREIDPRFERLVVQPGELQSEQQLAKPGHWTAGTRRMQAVYQDFVGRMQTMFVDSQGRPYPVEGTPLVLESTRPVALSKGVPKEIDTTFLVPSVDRPLQVRTELVERGFGRSLQLPRQPVTRMPSYQYYFVILAREPARYAFVKTLDAVAVPWDGESEADDTEDPLHYRVVSLAVERSIPLHDNPLTWTSIAYILWDEVDPKLFTPEQQRALVDWINWGGQLVVSGPDSLDLLQGSFLEPLLPATGGGSRKITASDLAEMNRNWLVPSAAGKPLVPTAPWSAVTLVNAAGDTDRQDALAGSTGGLLQERAVGRGRVVVSSVQLAERDLVNWQSGFQSLFNGGVLRRPPREYRLGYYDELSLVWADSELVDRRLDARLTTGMRYWSRDSGVDANYRYVEASETSRLNQWPPPGSQALRQLQPPAQRGGIAAWNDFGAASRAARTTLLEAAGVEVPDTSFVVICLTMYLVALVPLNWLVFSAIGRVEWAWIAAPIIAVAGTWIIVDRARLDIGFVRAQTEVSVLELQPNYDRGHLSRYTALYTSLSTTYDLEFDNLTAVAAPFSTQSEPQSTDAAGNALCDYERYDTAKLSGVFVPSNTTNIVHSEQMLPLKGAIRLGESSQRRLQIENRSQFHLHSAAIVARPSREEEANGAPALQGMWIGELLPGESAPAIFSQRIAANDDKPPFAEQRAEEEELRRTERLNLEPLFQVALDANNFEPGERRLVARIDEVLPGETIAPTASQVRGAVLVVAHLEYGPLAAPRPDVNTARDVAHTSSEPVDIFQSDP